MHEYDLGFAAKLAETADLADERDPRGMDARRVVAYLCRVSMEISMKALLEQAGVPIRSIRLRNHDLRGLLEDLETCEVLIDAEGIEPRWQPASIVKSECIDFGLIKVPIGEYIEATEPEVSKYPNQIRYGHTVMDFQPPFLIGSARLLAEWARKHSKTIRLRTQ
jgi:hypothetical protein